MNNLRKHLETLYNSPELRRSNVPLFYSKPGLGKTTVIREFAKSLGVGFVEMIASQMSPLEVSGITVPDHSNQRMVFYNYDKLLTLRDGDILFFDEILNAPTPTQNAMLTLFESRVLPSGYKLPDIMIVAAGNLEGAAYMTPQIKERFIWTEVVYSRDKFEKYLYENYVIPNIPDRIHRYVREEKFLSNGLNFVTPRSIEKVIKQLIIYDNTEMVYARYKSNSSNMKHIIEWLLELDYKFYDEIENFDENDPKFKGKTKWLDLMKIIYNEKT